MSAALLTLTGISVLGLAASFLIAMTASSSADISLHVLMAVFSTLLNLLSHSLMMFYLLGKGRAVKEAMAEYNLTGNYLARVAALRGPVFSRGTYAMVLTMATAIIGASVDVRVLPAWPHSALAAVAVLVNVWALWTEAAALSGTQGIVREVDAKVIW